MRRPHCEGSTSGDFEAFEEQPLPRPRARSVAIVPSCSRSRRLNGVGSALYRLGGRRSVCSKTGTAWLIVGVSEGPPAQDPAENSGISAEEHSSRLMALDVLTPWRRRVEVGPSTRRGPVMEMAGPVVTSPDPPLLVIRGPVVLGVLRPSPIDALRLASRSELEHPRWLAERQQAPPFRRYRRGPRVPRRSRAFARQCG